MLFCVIASGSFFFFKQKTAYEMRISDWSSDVCSSDLSADRIAAGVRRRVGVDEIRRRPAQPPRLRDGRDIARKPAVAYRIVRAQEGAFGLGHAEQTRHRHRPRDPARRTPLRFAPILRSEEHTSELQSLMRISYAVFCLKKKTMTLSPPL